MNKLILTESGSMYFDEDVLDFALSAIREPLNGIFSDADADGAAIIISGMRYQNSVPDDFITPGHFYWNGELFFCAGGAAFELPLGHVLGIAISETAANVEFDDAPKWRPVKLTRTGVISSAPAASPSFIPWTDFRPWTDQLGTRAVEAEKWHEIVIGVPWAGTIYYRLNRLSRTLQLRGSVTNPNALNLGGTAFSSLGWLPQGFIPAHTAYFTAMTHYHLNEKEMEPKFRVITGYVSNTGNIRLGMQRSTDPLFDTYTVHFNTIIPLD